MAKADSKSSYYKTGLDLAGFTPSSCNSPFLERALEKNWREGQNNIIDLPDDQVTVCDLYFAWLYGGNPFVLLKSDEYAESGRTTATKITLDEQLFLDSWVLGDKLLDHDFCDMVIDTIIDHARIPHADWWPFNVIFTIYEMTSDTAPVHRFLIDLYLYMANKSWHDHGEPEFNAKAYREITNALVDQKKVVLSPADSPWLKDPCVYHWHKKEGGLCYKQKGKWKN